VSALAPIPESELNRLARAVRAEHQAAEAAFESAVRHAQRCRVLLLEAKALCGHGEWLPWLREVGVPFQTASTYMRLAGRFPDQGSLPPTIPAAPVPTVAPKPRSFDLPAACRQLERIRSELGPLRPDQRGRCGEPALGRQTRNL
jgi:hypothetical protein